MSWSMKDVRDIRLLGTGFVAGMVLCYFLTLDGSAPAGTPRATVAAPLSPVLGNGAVSKTPEVRYFDSLEEARKAQLAALPLGAVEVRYVDLFEGWAAPRNQRMRIVPALRVEPSLIMPGAVPGAPSTPSVQSYDLIDLNYVPDFKLPD